MLKILGLMMVSVMVMLVLGSWGPQALAQPAISNTSQIISNIQNGITNENIAIMILNCNTTSAKYDDLYQGLKVSEYGKELNITVGICHHNVLYYYGICEQIETNINTTDQMSPDCHMAHLYLEMNNLLNETRPQNFVYDSEITQ